MIVDEDKLRERLEKKFSTKVVNNIIHDLKREGLPLKVAVSKLDIKIGEDVTIKFLNQKGDPPTGTDVLMKYNWESQIGNIDPNQITSINIPTLNYIDNGIMTIDVTLYPFKWESILKNIKKEK